nr:transcription antitermination factor NusB [Brevibacterium yomogidense]
MLFESEARGIGIDELVPLRSSDPDYPMKAYAVEIVEGVTAHREEIDDLVRTYARGWALDRMPAVDRAILRIASWEILHNDDIDAPVAISEAQSLAQDFSTDDSPGYVSGVLSRIAGLEV